MPAATVEKLLPSASLTLTDQRRRLRDQQEHRLAGDVAGRTTSAWMRASSRLRLPDGGRRDPPARSAAGWSSVTGPATSSSWRASITTRRSTTKLKAQTTGTAVIHSPVRRQQLARHHVAEGRLRHGRDRETDQIVTVAVECTPDLRRDQRHHHGGRQDVTWTPSASRRTISWTATLLCFDATRPIAINLRGPDGVKTVRVRFPSDDEWAERQRRRKVIVKQLGRGDL